MPIQQSPVDNTREKTPFSSNAPRKTTDHKEPQDFFEQCLWSSPSHLHSPSVIIRRRVNTQTSCTLNPQLGLGGYWWPVFGEGFGLTTSFFPLSLWSFSASFKNPLPVIPLALPSVPIELHLPAKWLQLFWGQPWCPRIRGGAAAIFSSSPLSKRESSAENQQPPTTPWLVRGPGISRGAVPPP